MEATKLVPEEWAASKFKVGPSILKLFTFLGSAAAIFAIYLNASFLELPLLLLTIGIIAGAFVFGVVRSKHAHVEVSYEKV